MLCVPSAFEKGQANQAFELLRAVRHIVTHLSEHNVKNRRPLLDEKLDTY